MLLILLPSSTSNTSSIFEIMFIFHYLFLLNMLILFQFYTVYRNTGVL